MTGAFPAVFSIVTGTRHVRGMAFRTPTCPPIQKEMNT